MAAHMRQNWREDLAPVWREFFQGIKPNLDGLNDWDVARVYPARQNYGAPQEAREAMRAPHMLRAFDGLTPDSVRVVILGQDPYPRQARATGRAFEDGEWDVNNPEGAAPSLRMILQSAAAHQQPALDISENESDWGTVCEAIREAKLSPPNTPAFFNDLATQGVLSVNAAWTFSSTQKTHKKAHLKVWRPVLEHLLWKLSWRDEGPPIVFLLLGDDALRLFKAAVGLHIKKDIINRAVRIATVFRKHPAYQNGRPYFEGQNPLSQVNDSLVSLGGVRIQWWPPRP
jgi:uracil DNA glycosylase